MYTTDIVSIAVRFRCSIEAMYTTTIVSIAVTVVSLPRDVHYRTMDIVSIVTVVSLSLDVRFRTKRHMVLGWPRK